MNKGLQVIWKWLFKAVSSMKDARKIIAGAVPKIGAKLTAAFGRTSGPEQLKTLNRVVSMSAASARSALTSYVRGALGRKKVHPKNVGSFLSTQWNSLGIVDKVSIVWILSEVLDSDVLSTLLENLFGADAKDVMELCREISDEVGAEPGQLIEDANEAVGREGLLDPDGNNQFTREEVGLIVEAGDAIVSLVGSPDQAEAVMAALEMFKRNPDAWRLYRSL